MEARKVLPNPSYFAFTATPKNKTLEFFGTAVPEGGKVRHVPFHNYSMKQNARIEHDKALERAVIDLLSDHIELFKQFSDNASAPLCD